MSQRLTVGLASLGLLTSLIGPSVAVAAPLDPITISAATHDFGDQEVGSSSASVTFTITNNTYATAHYVSRTTSGTNDFTLFSDTCEGDLAALATCDVNMRFNPSVEGRLTGSTSHEWDLGSAAADLTGNGIVTPPPIIPQLTIDILITSKVIDLDAGTMTLGLDAQPNRPVDYTYWATPTIGATIFAGSTHSTVIDCATLPGMVYAMVDDPLGNPLNEASDMVLIEPCVPTPTDLATILILNDTTVDFGANTRMVFLSNEVNGGISPYTYKWDRSNGDGLVTGTRDQTFTFDCSLLPTTIVGQATDANSDQVTDSLTVDACGDAPVSEPLTVVIENAMAYNEGTNVVTATLTGSVAGTTVSTTAEGAEPYTYWWKASIAGGPVTNSAERDYGDLVIDCNLYPSGASVEFAATSIGLGTVNATPITIPCPVAPTNDVVAPTLHNAPLPATDSIGAAERSIGIAPIVPSWIFIVVVVGLVALPSRRTWKKDR
jgi:hypothetical protein